MRRLTLTLALLLTTASAASAATWELLSESGSCVISLVPEMIDDGIFFVDRGEADCGPDIARITGYALNNDGQDVAFYSTLEGIDLIGQVRREEEGIYRGSMRNGMALRMEHRSGAKGIADPMTGLTNSEDVAPGFDTDSETTPPAPDNEAQADAPLTRDAGAADCLLYAGTNGCAEQEDLGPPDGGQLQTLTRMNLRDQGTTAGSQVIAQVDPGTCFQITFCTEDGEGRLWCGVQNDSLTGYLLKQDDKSVYSRNSCR